MNGLNTKILCVDDDPNILAGYGRQLRKEFSLDTALGGEAGLELLHSRGPFAVVVSDMRMPGMSGVEFLRRVRERAPESVRIMLTGNHDQQTAMDAINEGHIFRFLTKPCPSPELASVLRAGLEQYRLVTAEKELLEQTLRGSIQVMAEVLSLTNPMAFGRAVRIQRLVRKVAELLKVEDLWQLDVAALLSQIGCVTVPESILAKVYGGQDLPGDERQMYERHPEVGSALIAKIPRLQEVGYIVACQDKHFDNPAAKDGRTETAIPLGADSKSGPGFRLPGVSRPRQDHGCQDADGPGRMVRPGRTRGAGRHRTHGNAIRTKVGETSRTAHRHGRGGRGVS